MAKRKYLTSEDLERVSSDHNLVFMCEGCYFHRCDKKHEPRTCKYLTHPNQKEIAEKLGKCTVKKGTIGSETWEFFIFKRKKK